MEFRAGTTRPVNPQTCLDDSTTSEACSATSAERTGGYSVFAGDGSQRDEMNLELMMAL